MFTPSSFRDLIIDYDKSDNNTFNQIKQLLNLLNVDKNTLDDDFLFKLNNSLLLLTYYF